MPNDFEDILRESEIDSAKMIFRLTSELKEKELELGSLRSRSFEELQRNNKAKEAEFEALINAQEERIKKREAEIGKQLVEKEAHLWQKYQTMLEDSIGTHRRELEGERTKLNSEVSAKEKEIIEQKKALRLEMEELFKKWEAEREADFKNERETFIAELKLGRETARREAEERAKQLDELWKEKLDQTRSELSARHELELEETKRKLRQEHTAETARLTEKLNTDFNQKELAINDNYAKWLADNKKLAEDNYSKRLAQIEADFQGRIAGLEDALKKTEEELARRQVLWENKHTELKRFYSQKEASLETAVKETEAALLNSEKELAARYERLEKELLAKAEKQKLDSLKKEQALDRELADRTADLQAQFSLREKSLAERETKLSVEREDLNHFRNQVTDIIHQREAELTKAFEERYNLLKHSLEESSRIKAMGLARKYEEVQKQYAILSGQKDDALTRAADLARETDELKKALAEKDKQFKAAEEKAAAEAAQLRAKLESEFSMRVQAAKDRLAGTEETLKKDHEEKLRAEVARVAEHLKISEAGLAAQREMLNKQAAELEAKFMDGLRNKETEVRENFRSTLANMDAQLESARRAHEAELAKMAGDREHEMMALRSEYEIRLKKKEAEFAGALDEAHKQAAGTALRQAAIEKKSAEDAFLVKVRDMETRRNMLEQSLAFAARDKEASQAQVLKLKEDIEVINMKLEQLQGEKQQLIQENLSKARDLRQTIEKEFTEKLENIEKNYLSQMADTIRRSEDKEHAQAGEYFKKLEFIKQEYNAKMARQVKEMEDAFLDRESKVRSALEENYRLKEKALTTRYEQMERNYAAVLSDKTMQLDTDRAMADSIYHLKQELENRNRDLNEKILSYDSKLEESKKVLESSYAAKMKEIQDSNRMKTAQLENERNKLKGVLAQESQLVADLQKREAALQEHFARKEAELTKEFKETRERLENDYQAKLKSLKPGNGSAH
ncbi:MAG: hypothetical protein A3J79_14470 [Elusimicrobia bacterium RIFOXYB2_FULL_62_6]|nr:MAG: hypothetical protein A3J79_14470 [Elusimicrobia bacterium RIFOXYB2_FULL_62_6]